METDIDIQAIGYPAVRDAFNDVLQLCVERLAKAELKLAEEKLGLADCNTIASDPAEMLADTALYSCRQTAGSHGGSRRSIDRIALKLPLKHDPLKAMIAARLPSAIFSVFVVERAHDQGGVVAHDLLDDDQAIHIMDRALAEQVAIHGEFPIAGRFVDLGPWHIGFGIVIPLRKSEVIAIKLGIADTADSADARATLHELVYPAHLHGLDLVMMALEPAIAALAHAIDTDVLDIEDLAAGLGTLLSGKPAPRRKRKTLSP